MGIVVCKALGFTVGVVGLKVGDFVDGVYVTAVGLMLGVMLKGVGLDDGFTVGINVDGSRVLGEIVGITLGGEVEEVGFNVVGYEVGFNVVGVYVVGEIVDEVG